MDDNHNISFINMSIVPLEEDVLSLEINDSFYQSLLLEDQEFIT